MHQNIRKLDIDKMIQDIFLKRISNHNSENSTIKSKIVCLIKKHYSLDICGYTKQITQLLLQKLCDLLLYGEGCILEGIS